MRKHCLTDGKGRFSMVSGRVAPAALVVLLFAPLLSAGERESVLIRNVPHVRQKPDFCGEACAAMYLRKLNVPVDQDWVFDQAGLDPALGRGCYTRDLARALVHSGFKTGPVWFEIPVKKAAARLDEEFAALCADLKAGTPSIVCMRYNDRPNTTEHFRLVLGYDASADEVVYHEPAEDDGAYRRIARKLFLSLWPLKYADDTWTLVRMRLEPKRLPSARASQTFTDADYAQHILQLRTKLPHDGFSIVVQKPFVVVGDEPAETVRKRARDTVQWAVDHLKKDYFTADPADILDIWLFRDGNSYEEHAEKLFGSKPTTPYGYYSHQDKALVMNISTGGGTLVHEIVHPFIASNFPECPSWFNEGLASLYEQAAERDGHIVGLTNWRLKGLQQAIGKGTVPPFKTLSSTSTNGFYRQDPGTNYSQARYLCYYLQEKGLLVKYYHAFRKNVEKDPGGYETLKQVLGADDMAAFQKGWEKYVLELRF